MKKLIVAALLVVGMTTFAQEKEGRIPGKEKLTSEQKVNLQVKKMTKYLGLNETQTKEIRVLVTKEVEKREAKIEEMKAQRKAEQAAVSSDMKKILTPEQYAKWEKNREEKKESIKEKMAKRKSKDIPESK
jgi:protein CpxP